MADRRELLALEIASRDLLGLVVELLARVPQAEAWEPHAFAEVLVQPGTVAVGLFEPCAGRLAGLVVAFTDESSLAIVVGLVAEPGPRRFEIEERLMIELLARPELAALDRVELSADPDLTTFYRQFGFWPSTGGWVLLRRAANDAAAAPTTPAAIGLGEG